MGRNGRGCDHLSFRRKTQVVTTSLSSVNYLGEESKLLEKKDKQEIDGLHESTWGNLKRCENTTVLRGERVWVQRANVVCKTRQRCKETVTVGGISTVLGTLLRLEGGAWLTARSLSQAPIVNAHPLRPRPCSSVPDLFYCPLQEILANIQELQRQLWEHKNKEDQREENVSSRVRGADEGEATKERGGATNFQRTPASLHRLFVAVESGRSPRAFEQTIGPPCPSPALWCREIFDVPVAQQPPPMMLRSCRSRESSIRASCLKNKAEPSVENTTPDLRLCLYWTRDVSLPLARPG